MSLRTKLLGLFALLAILPLVGMGLFDYLRSLRALESLVAGQAAMFADRAATELADRYAIVDANVSLLAESEEASRLYEAGRIDREGRDFFNGVWSELSRDLAWAAYHDADGKTLFQLGDRSVGAAREYVLSRNVIDRSGRVVGSVQVAARLDSVIPQSALAARIGHSGASLVLDRGTGEVLYDTRQGSDGTSETDLVAGLRRWLPASTTSTRRGTFNIKDGDSTRMAAVVALAAPPVAILTAGTLEEFSGPFARILSSNLSYLIVLVGLLSAAFVVSLFRATHALSALTLAADEVGRGNLQPALPMIVSRDEVGRLASAFDAMLARLRSMLAEVERSRQLAAVGQFASQIAHEIRNPLTAIKLNLQRLDRAARRDDSSTDHRPIEIALRESIRLDRVVRGVLQLGRPGRVERREFDVNEAVRSCVERHSAELEEQAIAVTLSLDAEPAIVLGDRFLLESALTNVLLNAIEADASELTIATLVQENSLRITVADNGRGLSAEAATRVFEPFYTTKVEGTGLGMPLVQRTIEEHHGTIAIANRPDGASGAAVTIVLPVVGMQTS